MSVPFVKSNSSTESIKLIPEISKIPDLLAKALDPALVFVRQNFSCSNVVRLKPRWAEAFRVISVRISDFEAGC
jgi:hypothetical protein